MIDLKFERMKDTMNETKVTEFTGTKEQEQQLMEAIAQHKDQKGSLMPVSSIMLSIAKSYNNEKCNLVISAI